MNPAITARHRAWLFFAVLSSIASFACADLLGFEDARLDPLLSASDAGATGPEATMSATETDVGPSDESSAVESADAGMKPVLSPCEEFCQVVLEACQNDENGEGHAIYDSSFSCERQCAMFPAGEAGDETGNSLACRLQHARVALAFPGERSIECPAAGPGGDGICGSNCEGYCNLMGQQCGDYADATTCPEDCRSITDLGGFNVSQIEGNTLQCRFYHLSAALVGPTLHCPHAAGAYPCSDL